MNIKNVIQKWDDHAIYIYIYPIMGWFIGLSWHIIYIQHHPTSSNQPKETHIVWSALSCRMSKHDFTTLCTKPSHKAIPRAGDRNCRRHWRTIKKCLLGQFSASNLWQPHPPIKYRNLKLPMLPKTSKIVRSSRPETNCIGMEARTCRVAYISFIQHHPFEGHQPLVKPQKVIQLI